MKARWRFDGGRMACELHVADGTTDLSGTWGWFWIRNPLGLGHVWEGAPNPELAWKNGRRRRAVTVACDGDDRAGPNPLWYQLEFQTDLKMGKNLSLKLNWCSFYIYSFEMSEIGYETSKTKPMTNDCLSPIDSTQNSFYKAVHKYETSLIIISKEIG